MSTGQMMKILIVDDNAQYREAFKRALLVEGYEVCEAADAEEAVDVLHSETPDVVVTDLQMRTECEGLELIELIKAADPLLPVIMISGVGSFEEGALATKLGAAHVIHKSRIEDEMAGFFKTIRAAHETSTKSREQLELVARARDQGERQDGGEPLKVIKALLTDPDVDPYVKSEAYDFITSVAEVDMLRESESNMREATASTQDEGLNTAALARLREAIVDYDQLHEDSRKALTTAEYLYGLQEGPADLDFTRTVAFSYCFAVESEVRVRLKGKITRLASDRLNQRVFEACLEPRSGRMDDGFHQDLMLAIRDRGIHFSIDNVKKVLFGLIQRKEKFKPEGLRDVGILLLCFARNYSFSKWGRMIEVENQLRVKGLQDDDEIVHLAGLLIELQYVRNPYIHTDPHKREHLAKIRQTAFDCINELSKVV